MDYIFHQRFTKLTAFLDEVVTVISHAHHTSKLMTYSCISVCIAFCQIDMYCKARLECSALSRPAVCRNREVAAHKKDKLPTRPAVNTVYVIYWGEPFKPSRCLKASFYIPENRLSFPTTEVLE